jgi:peptidoglycan/LPS O-acetylase OafA/YrhL
MELSRFDYLDGWRGLAILLVLESHFVDLLPIHSGRLGVDVFFCLSGFLMSRILFIKRTPLPTFYKRRASRILPVFLLFVTVIYATSDGRTWQEALSTYAFMRTYYPVPPDIWNTGIPIGHLWSLNVEEHCYVLLSLFACFAFLRRREWLLLIGLGVLSVLVAVVYLKYGAPPWGLLGTETCASFLLLSAGYFLVRERLQSFVPAWLPLVTMAGGVLCYSPVTPWWASLLVAPFLLAFTVNHLSESPAWFRSFLSLPLLRLFGLWSYSIYLWQQPFHRYQSMLHFEGFPVAGLLAIGVGALSFYAFENPIRTWLNNRW